MPFFKFRKNGAEQSNPGPAPESLDVLRKRARHRLIGAAALVLLGVVGFPMLFDSQPRPISVDIAIEIPDKAKVEPLTARPVEVPAESEIQPPAPAQVVVTAPAADPVVTAAPTVQTAKVDPKPETSSKPKDDGKVAAQVADEAKAKAILQGNAAPEPAANAARYAVQVGAFADAQKAREARAALEKAGLKTYTQVITNADGRRTRVRVGPWEDKAEAEKAAEKIKKLNLPAAVLLL